MTQQRAVHLVGDATFPDQPAVEAGCVSVGEHGQPQFEGQQVGVVGCRGLPGAVQQGMRNVACQGDDPARQGGFGDGFPGRWGKVLEVTEIPFDQVDGLVRVQGAADHQFRVRGAVPP